MKSQTTDTVITAALRHLDGAPRTDLTEAERERADATLARIVATPTDEPIPVEPNRPHRRRGRLLVTVGLAGAAAVAGVAIPGLLLDGGEAYGSWTPTPEPLSDPAAAEAATTCRSTLGAPDGGRVAIAERRGEWTYVLLAGPGIEAVCLMPDDSVGHTIADGEDFFGSYTPDPAAPPTLVSDRIDETTSQDGSTDEGWFTRTEGYVGSDVTGVTVHTSSGLDIEASVVGNRFAAWWPSTEQNSDHPAETWSYTVHIADGSTRRTTG
ncbi:hypothetical protein D0Z08_25725 [Nocardioides immobilis]|uniref:Uncharacterized protein n=1 Tax=Nocardioides immobilis TaxID=2049295 RepID=A0A417XUV5_9ACTN|nr:hypothetical protein [Nocardioides immobilis]RHW24126.1 hypothetical protein D0Z08_25725 [Nocardioides immobilis]